MNYVAWGHHNSWIVHGTDAGGRIVWCSHWMATKAQAVLLRDQLAWRIRKVA